MRKAIILSIMLFFITCPVITQAAAIPGNPAPDFTLTSVDGQEVSLSSLKGKVILVGMFHICVPCMNQAMEFNKVRDQLPSDNLVILGINTSGDSRNAVMKYMDGFPQPVKFTYLLDPDKSVHRAYIQRDMPTVLIIDSKGVIRARTPSVGADQLVPYLKKLL